MTYSIRPIEHEDYDTILVHWWKQWRWIAPSRDFLPDDGKNGLIVYDGDTPICAGFLYITNSKVSWVDWVISNMEYTDREKRKEALLLLVDTLTRMSKDMGNKYVYALIKNESLINTYIQLGYTQASSYTSEMIKTL